MDSKPLTLPQIVELAAANEMDVRRDMRRGILPSMEPEIVREWLRERWSRAGRNGLEVS